MSQFINLPSRLGSPHPTYKQLANNTGVEQAGEAILQSLQIPKSQIISNPFPAPDQLPSDNYLPSLLTLYQQTIQNLIPQIPSDQTSIFLGGDHSISYITLSAILQKHRPENVYLIMFDSHGDIHTPETSPSHNFHGMWLRALLKPNHFPFSIFHYSPPSQITYIGNLDLQVEEQQFIDNHQIQTINEQQLNSAISNLINQTLQFPHLHISFDIDVLNSSIVSATGTPNPIGLPLEPILQLLHVLSNHPSISLDIVEYNPLLDSNHQTLNIIQQILSLFNPSMERN